MKKELVSEATEYSKKADEFQKEGNYQFAQKCYAKVAFIMKEYIKIQTKPELLQLMKEKINKYENLAAQMLIKHKQKELKITKTNNISKFGFPTTQRISVNDSPMNIQKKPKDINLTLNPKKIKKQQVDKEVAGLIVNNINVSFADIVGMQEIKQILYQCVIIPRKRPDLFSGIRSPPRGILMYGPPGNGKTLIAKALAKQSQCTFYNISAASIMNKFVGESEKMLRKVFQAAHQTSPSIIFIDQIDSMLTARSQNENQTSRRLKTQYLVQFDGVTTSKDSHVVVIGATNLPNQIDIAALRRFNKLVYIGLPSVEARQKMVLYNLKQIGYTLSAKELKKLSKQLEGYSASEINDIVKEASMEPIRELKKSLIEKIEKKNLRNVCLKDFQLILKKRKPLLSKQDLAKYDAKFH